MVLRPLRPLAPPPTTEALYDAWLDRIGEALDRGDDRAELCHRVLVSLFYPQLADVDPRHLPLDTQVALAQLDPHNVTLEPEYYAEIDDALYQPRKPLIWLWQMFDRSPLGGNVHLGVRFRRLLAPYIFRRVGRNFKCFHFVEFSFGYNLEIGDDVVVHRNVLLDDRGGIVIGHRVSISDYANIYSHAHSIVDIQDVTNAVTIIGDGVRITYHATVLAGVRIGDHAMVGAHAVVTRDVPAWHVVVGVPAKTIRIKPNAPPEVLRTTVVPPERASSS